MASKKEIKAKAKKIGYSALQKTSSFTKKAGKSIVSNPITALNIIIGLAGVLALYKIYKFINTGFEGDPHIDNEVIGTGGNTDGATISNQQAKNFAQQLLDAMNVKQPFWGTDEETIEAVFSQLTVGADFIKVYEAFGKKDYNGNNSPPTGVWSSFDSYEPKDLVYWLKSEISTADKAYKIVKERIESTGVFVF